MSEVPGQSGHALPAPNSRFVPTAGNPHSVGQLGSGSSMSPTLGCQTRGELRLRLPMLSSLACIEGRRTDVGYCLMSGRALTGSPETPKADSFESNPDGDTPSVIFHTFSSVFGPFIFIHSGQLSSPMTL
jgi:hypothetical protein